MAGGADCVILRPDSMTKISNLAAYKFTALPEVRSLRSRLLALCKSWQLKGTILLATEGINLFVAGSPEKIEELRRAFDRVRNFR